MHIQTTTVDPYTVDAQIELGQEELERHLRTVRESLARGVQVEGFRKGKAPQHLVDQQLSEQAVRAEALEVALAESFTEAVAQQGWDVESTADLKVQENTAQKLVYAVRVRTWPRITLPDLAGISVPRREPVIEEHEVDEALDTVRNMRAQFLDKTEPAVAGDRVEVDFDASVGGAPVEGGSSRNHPLIIGGKNFMPGFEEELIGLSAGQAKQFTLTAPADYYETSLAGKTIDFSVTVRRVQAVLKPAADDAFARSLGQFTDLAHLRSDLREGLLREKRTAERQRLRLAILDAIISAGPVPAPAYLCERELDEMLHRFSHDLRDRGMELSMYLARLSKTQDQLRTEWMPQAERQVRIMLILRELSRAQNITVDPQELETQMNAAIGEMVRSGQATEDQVDPERIRTALHERMLTEKALSLLETRCAA